MERQIDRHGEIDRERDRERQTDTQGETDRERKANRQTDKQTGAASYMGIGSSRRHFSSVSSVWAAKERRKMAARSLT